MMDHVRWMRAAIALGERARGTTAPNPNVGCIIVRDDVVVGRGWTQPDGRPHAEAMALDAAGKKALGATVYVTLEPCAHHSVRGPACANLLAEAGVAQVIAALADPDPRTSGSGLKQLSQAGIETICGVEADAATDSLAGFLMRMCLGRPYVTLKLALSLDGKIALATGESRWISGEEARAHAHMLRARSDMILIGRGTYEADAPKLDVRLPGLEHRVPQKAIFTSGPAPAGWVRIDNPSGLFSLTGVNDLLVEGGAGTATALLAADLVDQLVIYRAPILIGEGKSAIGDIGLGALAQAHGRWRPGVTRMLGSDRLEVYERVR